MEQLTKKELEKVISLYLDGELDSHEQEQLHEYLSLHPNDAKDFELYRAMKQSLGDKEKLPANDWFWLKLSNKLEAKQSPKSLYTFFGHPKVALTSVSLFVVLVIGGVFIKDAPVLKRYFKEKKELVQNTLMSGNIFPLFTNLNKDDVLNFALFGNLPIDSARQTELQVTNNNGKGAQFEIVSASSIRSQQPVSLDNFFHEVEMSPSQQKVVDSILGSFKQKLQASVLVSENKEIAIHEGLVALNRAMVNTIAASLQPYQRNRLQRYLTRHDAPYSVVAMNAPVIAPQVLLRNIPALSRSARYVYLSKDTVGIAEMKMNVDSIREFARNNVQHERRLAAEGMLRDIAELRRGKNDNIVVTGNQPSQVQVHSTDNAFQINFETSTPMMMNIPEIGDMVRPRMRHLQTPEAFFHEIQVIGDSAFAMEMYPDSEALKMLKKLPSGEFRYEYIDSLASVPRMKLIFRSSKSKSKFERRLQALKQRKQEKLIDLDSLLRESEKESIKSQPVAPKAKVKMYEM